MTNQPREFTLRGYVEIIRRQAWLVVIIGVLCAGAAFAYTKLKPPSYSATSSLTVNDPNQALSYTGSSYFSGQTPLQEASVAAPEVTRPAVVEAVRRRLGPSASSSSVSVSVDPNSYAIKITATSHSATQAAAVANAFATSDVALTTAQARANYRAQAQAVAQQIRRMPSGSAQAAVANETLGRLQNLSAVAQPLNIATTAAIPGSPSSSAALITLAALLFGLLLGVAVATARDALDRRLRSPRDLATLLDHPVIGHVRTSALGRTGAPVASSNGSRQLQESDQESFRILRQNLSYLGTGRDSATVLVTSAASEEGKSTVAACLAVATAESGRRTLLVECDLRRPVLAKRLGLRQSPGLTDYLTASAQPHEVLQPIEGIAERLNGSGPALNAGGGGCALVCITSGRPVVRPAELLASERFRDFLAQVSAVYDTVILDSAPLLPVADSLGIVPIVSTVIVCVRLERTTRDQVMAVGSALHRLPERPVGVVLTDVRERDGYYYNSDYRTPTRTPLGAR